MRQRPTPPLDDSISVLPGFIDFHHAHNPDHSYLVFSSDDESVRHTHISYAEFARATHRVAHAVNEDRRTRSREVVALIANCDTILYIALLVGITRAGLVPFPISPRNPPAAILSMMKKTNSHRLLTTYEFLQPLIEGVKEAFSTEDYALQIDQVPSLREVYPVLGKETDDDPFEPYPDLDVPSKPDDVVMYLHSSGSTGFPKPIPQTRKSILHWCSFPSITGLLDHPRETIFGTASLPSFHTMGVIIQLYSALVATHPVVVFPPRAPEPPFVPTPENTIVAAIAAHATAIAAVPTFWEAWAQSEEAVKFLASLDYCVFAGGPVSDKLGNYLVSQGVKFTSIYGGTEFGPLTHTCDLYKGNQTSSIYRPPGLWAYMRFSDRCKCRWVDQGDGTYELQLLTNEGHQVSVENLTDVKGYATSDLWEKHPEVDGLWKIVGRTDDVLVLASGEKTVPAPSEGHILSSPLVQGTVTFGRGRDQVGVLIEPKPEFSIDPNDLNAVAAFRNRIWPVVEEANKTSPAFSRIFKEMILFASPEKPLIRAPKGTVMRRLTLDAYAPEIDALYETVASSFDDESVGQPIAWTADHLVDWLFMHAEKINDGRRTIPDVDLFEQGFDSLSATYLRNRVIGALRASADPAAKKAVNAIPQNIVYSNPTLVRLASAVASAADPKQVADESVESRINNIQEMIRKYSLGFSSGNALANKPADADAVAVLITGTTGNLGSHILRALLEDPHVVKVYAYNRKSSSSTSMARQLAAFEEKGFDVEPLRSGRVVFVEGDASQEMLGLNKDTYEDIHRSVTHIVHNAWRLDFNLTLPSFESNIRATRNLIDFSLTSLMSPRFLFTSSVAVAQSWDKSKGPYPEQVVPGPQWAIGTGYGEGKYVAEQILANAAVSGLESTSFRIGQISGGLPNGAWATTDWVPILVKSSVAIGSLPDAPGVVSWIPMHAVAETILDVALSPVDMPPAVNIVHPRPSKWTDIMRLISDLLVEQGVVKSRRIELVAFPDWLKKIEDIASAQRTEDFDLIPAVKLLDFYRHMATVDDSNEAQSREAGGLATFSTVDICKMSETIQRLEPLGKEDVERWIDFWVRRGFLVES